MFCNSDLLLRQRYSLTLKPTSTPATMSKQRSTLSKLHSTLLSKTATVSNDFIVKFRHFDKVACCFDIVAVFGDNVERVFREILSLRQGRNKLSKGRNFVRRCYQKRHKCRSNIDFVERIVRLVAFHNVASRLLWTGLKPV